MLTAGTYIQIRADGATKPIEQLQIADLIFDPFRGEYCEIVDILSRTTELFPAPAQCQVSPLHPVRMKVGSVGDGLPRRDLVTSPSQPVMVRANQRSAKTAFDFSMASTLVENGDAEAVRDATHVTYFAVFTSEEAILVAEGLPTLTYVPSILEGPGEYSANRVD